MEMIVRKMEREDLEEALAVERSAIGTGNLYLADAFDYYTSTKGELSVACVNQKIVGIGKLTVLFDGSAWLELLRVHKDYQQMGVGTALYQNYFRQLKAYQCLSAGLYTGIKNIGSCTLAKNFGLATDCFYISFSQTARKEETYPFKKADKLPKQQVNVPNLNINHTFYPVNEATLMGFLSQGWVYTYQDTLLIMGSRFQPVKALYIAYIQGSFKKEALAYALNSAYMQGIEKVIYHFPKDQADDNRWLKDYGFSQDAGEDMIMQIHFDRQLKD